MAILVIKKYPDPVLRKKAEEVKEIGPDIKKLAQDMVETMIKSEPKGVGLAAPQVGVSKMILVAQTESGPGVFINPKILSKGKKTDILEEGCLSLPKFWLKVKRSRTIELEALDIDGEKMRIKAEGFFARVLQHEIDHLQGILIIDRRSLWQKIKKSILKK